jgi:O-antigen/teichoic acid export membrane protein
LTAIPDPLGSEENLGGAVAPSGRSRIGHNAVLNFVGLAAPLALAFFVMPVAARYLGAARFGLLGLAWAITEYLTLFDLGLGRALVKFVAEAIHRQDPDLGDIVSLSVAAQFAAGVVGGIAFFLFAPILVHHVFKVAPVHSAEALGVFRIVGISLPFVLLISAQRAVLEGAQRFDLSAALKMVGSVASVLIPAIGAVLGVSLPVILLYVLASRVVVVVLFAAAIRRAVPTIRWLGARKWSVLRRVASFGGWVFVSNTVSPLLVYFDRFALGTIAGLSAVGFYTAPYEGLTRFLVLPASLFGSLLPVLTSIEADGDSDRFARVSSSSQRVSLTMMALPLSVAFIFAPELLSIWLGADYAAHSATALRALTLGVMANALAMPLLVLLYAKHRPDLPAKFHLFELAVHIPLTILLIRAYGISGAAAAWTIRVTIDMCLLFWAGSRVSRISVGQLAGGDVVKSATWVLLLVVSLAAAKALSVSSMGLAIVATAVTLLVFAAANWRWVLTQRDRSALTGTLRSYAKLLPHTAFRG